MVSEWQQVSSSLLDSSQYSGRCQQCYRLDGLDCSPISYSFSLLSQPLETVPSAPITIGITVALMLTAFLVLKQDPSTCLSFSFLWFSLCDPQFGRFSSSFFLLIITRSGLLAGIRWSILSLLLLFYFLRVFHASVCWWSFIRVWVTASLLMDFSQYLADPSKAVIWMVLARPPISTPSSYYYYYYYYYYYLSNIIWDR